jgi:hypothetical protein
MAVGISGDLLVPSASQAVNAPDEFALLAVGRPCVADIDCR